MNDSRPPAPPAGTVVVAADALVAWGARVFEALGCASAEALRIADGLVQANLYGHDSHGIGLVPQYAENVRAGHAVPNREVRVVRDAGTLVALDGGKGFGQSTGAQAMALAVERAREHGCAVVGLANTHHLGRIGQWGEQCAAAGMVSIHFVNVLSRPLVAPWGGTDARVSTNPFCVAVPHAPHPIVLDYATASIALGKTRVAVDEGRAMHEGLLLDANGRPTTDPRVMWNAPYGAILPFGEHKGWALSLMCEIVGGALSGGHAQDGATRHPMLNNMTTFVADPAQLGTGDALPREIAALAAWVRASPAAADAAQPISLPGEPERRLAAARGRDGIPLPARTHEQLVAAAASVGVAPPR